MMKMKNRAGDPTNIVGIFVSGVILLAIALVLLAMISAMPKRPLIVSFVRDESYSTPAGHSCVEQAIKEAVNRATDYVEFRYMKTGNELTAFEPVQSLAPLKIRKSDIPWSAGPNAIGRLTQPFVSTIARSPSDGRTGKSPIFISVERAVAELRTRSDADRIAIIETDLEDTTVPALVRNFKESPGAKLKNLPKIDNGEVRVHFVSIQATVGEISEGKGLKQSFTAPRTPERIKRLQEVWKACFTAPELVSFSPSCNNPIP